MQNFPFFNLKPTLSEKYDMYVSTHPKCKNMSKAEVAKLMFDKNLISVLEMAELQNSVFSKNADVNKDFGYKAMGLDLFDTSNKTHPVFSQLEMVDDKSNKVDLSKYTYEALKASYDNQKYNILQDKNGKITVSEKNGTPVLEIDNLSEFQAHFVFYNNGKKSKDIMLDKSGKQVGVVKFAYICKYENGTEVTEFYDKDNVLPYSRSEKFRNGDVKRTTYSHGQISYQEYFKTGASSPAWFVVYSNGKPYKKQNGYDDKNPQYILVDDLKNDIYAKTKLGLPTTRSSISENVLKRINYKNVEETLNVYKEKTGNDLIQDIKDEIGLNSKLKDKLVNHIESLYVQYSNPKEAGKWLAQQLYSDIKGAGSGDLVRHIKLLDSRTLTYVLIEYRNLSSDNKINMEDRVYNVLNVLESIPFVSFDYNTSKKLVENLAPIEGLLTAISGEWGLKESVRNDLIKQIIDISLANADENVQKRAKKDINSHPKDYHKVEVDLYRAKNARDEIEDRTPQKQSELKQTADNKTFSGQIRQGGTGDCWLLAGLNSIIAKPEMLKELEKKVTVDSKTGDYLVTLQDKVFRITKEDFNSYTNLSRGSEKVNAVEIAMDKLIRDEAYENKDDIFTIDDTFGIINNVTIDGNFSRFLWRSLFGFNYDICDVQVDPKTEDFNKPDRVYSVSFGGNDKEEYYRLASSEKEKICTLHSRHAYSIIGSDENNIYLLNPWDSSDKITISRENFSKLETQLNFYEIHKN